LPRIRTSPLKLGLRVFGHTDSLFKAVLRAGFESIDRTPVRLDLIGVLRLVYLDWMDSSIRRLELSGA
jgi:hypothetical protein